MNWCDEVEKRLKADEKNYKFVCYDPVKDKICHVKSQFRLMPSKKFYLDCFDGELFGVHIAKSKTKNWKYLGKL